MSFLYKFDYVGNISGLRLKERTYFNMPVANTWRKKKSFTFGNAAPLLFQTQEVQKAMDEKKFDEAVRLRGRFVWHKISKILLQLI